MKLNLAVWSARRQFALVLSLLGLLTATLWKFPPELYPFYPMCPFYRYLGVHCPGCGLTRAVADLLAGNVEAAAAHNPLAFLLAPVACAFLLLQGYSILRWNRWDLTQHARLF